MSIFSRIDESVSKTSYSLTHRIFSVLLHLNLLLGSRSPLCHVYFPLTILCTLFFCSSTFHTISLSSLLLIEFKWAFLFPRRVHLYFCMNKSFCVNIVEERQINVEDEAFSSFARNCFEKKKKKQIVRQGITRRDICARVVLPISVFMLTRLAGFNNFPREIFSAIRGCVSCGVSVLWCS